MEDIALLQEYARTASEPAFAALVERHVGLVYSAARRQLRDPHLAEDVTQAVFVILARKAGQVSRHPGLSGWLLLATRYAANAHIRAAIRRTRREQEAAMQSELNESSPAVWTQLEPLLDEAMASLGETDRAVLALRYFENQTAAEIGRTLKLNEEAAKKRVSRALEKLRRHFAKRGVTLSGEATAETISANSIQAAPVALAKAVTAVAIAKGAAASTSTLTLIKGALKIMAWTKAKTAIVVGVVAILTAGTTTITVKEIVAHREESHDEALWRVPHPNPDVLLKVRPQVTILPTKFQEDVIGWMHSGGRRWGIGLPAKVIVSFAYDCPPGRVFFASGDPQKRYDFIANLPKGSDEALQRELKNKFGLVARMEMRDTDVLALRVQIPNAPGLQPPVGRVAEGAESDSVGNFHVYNEPISAPHPSMNFTLTIALEGYFGMPIVDQTGLKHNFEINLRWKDLGDQDPHHDALKRALLDQLGLELVPTNLPVQMLVVEQAK